MTVRNKLAARSMSPHEGRKQEVPPGTRKDEYEVI